MEDRIELGADALATRRVTPLLEYPFGETLAKCVPPLRSFESDEAAQDLLSSAPTIDEHSALGQEELGARVVTEEPVDLVTEWRAKPSQ
mgnify:CR=1 FL=1